MWVPMTRSVSFIQIMSPVDTCILPSNFLVETVPPESNILVVSSYPIADEIRILCLRLRFCLSSLLLISVDDSIY